MMIAVGFGLGFGKANGLREIDYVRCSCSTLDVPICSI